MENLENQNLENGEQKTQSMEEENKDQNIAQESQNNNTIEVVEEKEAETTQPQTTNSDATQKTEGVIEELISFQPEENVIEKKKTKKVSISLKKFIYILIALIVIALTVVFSLWGSQIINLMNKKSNRYGFDYNYSKVKNHDWDSILTKQKISSALDVSLAKINTQKNPDYSWVLESPDELVNKVICASILEEKILHEEDETKNHLFNVSIMICKDTKKGEELFTTREDNLQLLIAQDDSIKIISHNQSKDVGLKSYDYILEKKISAKEGEGIESTSLFSGIVFLRGPFLVRIEESENDNFTVLADESQRLKLAEHIDQEIRSTLSLF